MAGDKQYLDILLSGMDSLGNQCDNGHRPDSSRNGCVSRTFVGEFPKTTISAESYGKHFDVNCRAVALMTAEFTKRHIARKSSWGRIINISTDGAFGYSEVVSYYASKWGAESYARAAAVELGPYGITVNVISPGAVNTGLLTKENEKELANTYPLRRLGRPEDIANAAIFPASVQADWITGQVLYAGGGNRM